MCVVSELHTRGDAVNAVAVSSCIIELLARARNVTESAQAPPGRRCLLDFCAGAVSDICWTTGSNANNCSYQHPPRSFFY
ncbi:MAG: hypothetical protein J07HX5_01609 [halophilic archaeon J07HX5]|nr:MAG: hypothetical protein J07HX5_01609 [halophilic archaeon J07HX5]